uniref:Ubiquitin-like domain-containing protein n=1 Tax=Arundo donax TaxID=35708 RepID=A0A0A9DAL1_ARUDO
MVKIPSPRRLFRSRSRSSSSSADICAMVAEHEKIEWEVRPGGMLVQKRRSPEEAAVEVILVRVSTTAWQWHDVSIDATATFGDLKVMLSLVTGLWPREQRLLYRGKERDDCEHLHMVGVQDKDKGAAPGRPGCQGEEAQVDHLGAAHGGAMPLLHPSVDTLLIFLQTFF